MTLDNKILFVFYGAAVARVNLVPLGLALFVFPFMWNAAVAGF